MFQKDSPKWWFDGDETHGTKEKPTNKTNSSLRIPKNPQSSPRIPKQTQDNLLKQT